MLALLEADIRGLLQRQGPPPSPIPLPFSARWERVCDHLEEDLASGHVRVLQEMAAAGWSDAEVARGARRPARPIGDFVEHLRAAAAAGA